MLDLNAASHAGLLGTGKLAEVTRPGSLNPLLASGRETWTELRARIQSLLVDGSHELDGFNHTMLFRGWSGAEMVVPFEVGDYIDFYSSLEHATNLGKIMRPGTEPLLPNWRWLPIGYHGRAGSIVIDGTPIVRPCGQIKTGSGEPIFGPSRMLDFETEVAFVTGHGNALGERITADRARDHIFGLVLLNDWSARDIQAWEYQPLGPFLGKSFATSISPWVVTLEALEPYRVPGPPQDPAPLEYLRYTEDWNYDISLKVDLQTERMRERPPPVWADTISRSNYKYLYWNMAQQLAHASSNGATIRPGDLFASGTISGSEQDSYGSMIELTSRGSQPLTLSSGEERGFLEDGDSVTIWGHAGEEPGPQIGFGRVRGTIVPAR